MKKLVRSLFVGAAIAMPLTLIATTPAVALGEDVGVVTGGGSISPGLGVTPANQTFHFSGTATVVGTDGVAASFSCSFDGSDSVGTAALGTGPFSGGCGPISFSNCTFVRATVAVVVACNDGVVKVAAGACVFVPSDVNPTKNYTLVCAFDYTQAP
jgi:hypothetical protein